jgi:hypothetical protein
MELLTLAFSKASATFVNTLKIKRIQHEDFLSHYHNVIDFSE